MRCLSAFDAALHRAARLLLVLFAVLGGGLSAASAAQAAPIKAIWGGVTDAEGQSEFPTYKSLGVNLWMTGVSWDQIAPTQPANPVDPNDPAYVWPASLDLAVTEGAKYGIDVGVLVMFTPGWANGNVSRLAPPTRPGVYAQFVEALAKRYPSIRRFMVWGEPNLADKFAITPSPARDYYAKSGNAKGQPKPLLKTQQKELNVYAQMIDATSVRLKKLNKNNLVIGGNTTTSGSIDPFSWVRYLRLPNGKPPRMDLYGHNPFGTRGPDLKKDQILPGTADFSDLDVFIPWIKKYLARSGRNPKIKLFAAEYTAPTDEKSYEFPYYVTRAVQASWLKSAWKIAKTEKLYALGWFALRDTRLSTGQVSRIGLIDLEGNQKPSYKVYESLR
ncbi:MAG: hypothetical protein Q7T55_15025 [Solirubrobacteraceae bacterium]|nr:hypothetical protein [Solirubrobacteraceae bacterium]